MFVCDLETVNVFRVSMDIRHLNLLLFKKPFHDHFPPNLRQIFGQIIISFSKLTEVGFMWEYGY